MLPMCHAKRVLVEVGCVGDQGQALPCLPRIGIIHFVNADIIMRRGRRDHLAVSAEHGESRRLHAGAFGRLRQIAIGIPFPELLFPPRCGIHLLEHDPACMRGCRVIVVKGQRIIMIIFQHAVINGIGYHHPAGQRIVPVFAGKSLGIENII